MEELTATPAIANRKREYQITKKLLAIIGSFFVLNLAVSSFFLAATQYPIILLASISDCFTCLNSGVNIFIYGTLDTRFRNVFKTLFCKKCTDGTIKVEGSTVATATRNIKTVSTTNVQKFTDTEPKFLLFICFLIINMPSFNFVLVVILIFMQQH